MKISMDMVGLNIVFTKEDYSTVSAGIELTVSDIGTELHLSHNALRSVEKAIKLARVIQGSSLEKGEGHLLSVFKANI